MAFCKHCGLRLAPTAERCPYCGVITNSLSPDDEFRSAIINMPPDHVLRRRKNFPIRDALYEPAFPEYQRFQQGAKVVRKTHWLAYSALFLVSCLLLVSVYNLLSAGVNSIQWLLAPPKGTSYLEITPIPELTPQIQAYLNPTPTPTLMPTPTSAPSPTPTKAPSPTPTPHKQTKAKLHPTPTPDIHALFEDARAVIARYYQHINARNYHAAYKLWQNNPLDYTTFTHGFTYTQHDTIKFGELSPQSHTTVRIALTVQATETIPRKHHATRTSLYQGYYFVQHQPDQSWKIIAASFQRL